ncbi:M56 family metallopeptidase [Sphingomonas flavalba]|uniref:M56 family metallopeptidase n=1 Tax=Sphingomonas flavalba TaxID=2559804 RepID=UPI0039DFFF45
MSGWIVETLIATTVLMLVVLLLRGPMARRFGPRVAYALWLLPAIRMVLPPLPTTAVPHPIAALPPLFDIEIVREAALAAPVTPAFDWAAVLLTLWLAGAVVHFLWHLGAYSLFVRRVIGRSTPLPMLDRDGIEVCASRAVRGPFATGIFIKTIVLPHDYRRRYDADELRLAMAHEAQHHRRCDMSANLVALIILSVHWFNPIAHRAHRAFRVDQELACDAVVLATATSFERHAYGLALLKSTCDRLPVAACALGAGDDLKRRLKMMGHDKPGRGTVRCGTALALLLTGGGLLLTASGGIAADAGSAVREDVKRTVAQTADWAPVAMPRDESDGIVEVPTPSALSSAPSVSYVVPAPPAPPESPAVPREDLADMAGVERAVGVAMRDVDRDVQVALADARRAAADARRDALTARREAADAARQAHARIRVVMRDCGGRRHAPTASISYDRDGSALRTVSVCENGGVDGAEIRQTVISALEGARQSVAAMDLPAAGEAGRAQALASIDRKIADLRAR